MNFLLILAVIFSSEIILTIANDANFDLVNGKSSTSLFDNENSEFELILRHIAHAKALLILYWQERQELNQKIPENYKLKLMVRWMNCFPRENHLHEIPSQNVSIVNKERLLNLYDFDCVPDQLRDWCVEDPGRELSFSYVLEKRYGYSIKMEFTCDPKIEKRKDNGGSWSYGVAGALIVLASVWVVRKYRKRTDTYQDPYEAQFSSPPFKQDPNFLTVPLRVRRRKEDSGIKMMEARSGYVARDKARALSVVVGAPKEAGRGRKLQRKVEVPKIYVYGPDD